MKKLFLGALAILLLCSHQMFLKFDSYFLEPNQNAVLQLFNGTFDQSDNVIDRNRMVDASLVGNNMRIAIDSTQWFEENTTTYLNFKTGDAGTWMAGVSTAPRAIDLDATAFNEYLEHDGVQDMLKTREENNTLNQDVREKYSKHVKTIFQVGTKLSDDWKTSLGYPIEFIPLQNPYDIHPGHELQVQLLFQGKPLTNQLVYLGFDKRGSAASEPHSHGDGENTHTHENGVEHTHGTEKEHSHDTEKETEHTHANGETHSHETSNKHTHDEADESEADHEHAAVEEFRTNEEGLVTLQIDETGVYYLRSIHMAKSEGTAHTHESNWATLTFEVGSGHSHDASDEHSDKSHEHEEKEFPSYIFWIASFVVLGALFFWFRRKK